MQASQTNLPSNKRFGLFFTLVFTAAAAYFFLQGRLLPCFLMTASAIILSLITILNSDLLLPLNILWGRLGTHIGRFVNPIILGFIFFGIFTPAAILMRICGRDELRIRTKGELSHWIFRSESNQSGTFENQF